MASLGDAFFIGDFIEILVSPGTQTVAVADSLPEYFDGVSAILPPSKGLLGDKLTLDDCLLVHLITPLSFDFGDNFLVTDAINPFTVVGRGFSDQLTLGDQVKVILNYDL